MHAEGLHLILIIQGVQAPEISLAEHPAMWEFIMVDASTHLANLSWTIGPVEGEASKTLEGWYVHKVPFDGPDKPLTRHLVGTVRETGNSRASMPVARIDVAKRLALTRSGRIYSLAGRSGTSQSCIYIWGQWCWINHMPVGLDVTAEVEALLNQGSGLL